MIRIGICDDEKVYREQIREICESFFDEGEAEYFLSSNGAELTTSHSERWEECDHSSVGYSLYFS